MIQKLSILLFAGLLAGCASTVALDPVVQKPPPVSIPTVQPLSLNSVQWQVMNLSDLKALLAKNTDVVLFTLDANNYQNLNSNFVEIKRYLTEQKAVLVLLKKVVDQESGVVSNDTTQQKTK